MRAKQLATKTIAREGLRIFTIRDVAGEVSSVHLTSSLRRTNVPLLVASQDVSQEDGANFIVQKRHMPNISLGW